MAASDDTQLSDEELALSDEELAFLRTLNELGVRYLIVGMSGALLQGASLSTEDINIWFERSATLGSTKLREGVVVHGSPAPSHPDS